jgi:hypothetical protein
MINVSQGQGKNKEGISSSTYSSILSDLDLLFIPYGQTLNLVITDQSNTNYISLFFFLNLSFDYLSFCFSTLNSFS